MPATDPTPRPAVSAAIFRDGHVLLVQRRFPPFAECWTLPGGHIKAGEAALDAVQRELREETAIEATVLGPADVVNVIERGDNNEVLFHRVIVVFYGVWRAGEARPGDDAGAAKWVHRLEIAKLRTTYGLAEAISKCWTQFCRENASTRGYNA